MEYKSANPISDPFGINAANKEYADMVGLESIIKFGRIGSLVGLAVGAYFLPEISKNLTDFINYYQAHIDTTHAVAISKITAVPLNFLTGFYIGKYGGRSIAWRINPVGKYTTNVLDMNNSD